MVLLEIAKQAVTKACHVTRYVASQMMHDDSTVTEYTLGKADLSPVTVADFAAQAVICKHLSAMSNNTDNPIKIMAEEDATELRDDANFHVLDRVVEAVRVVEPWATGEKACDWIDLGNLDDYNADGFWTLDPIDGTKGFLRRQQYAICLSYIQNGIPIVGVMGCPNLSLHSNDTSATDVEGGEGAEGAEGERESYFLPRREEGLGNVRYHHPRHYHPMQRQHQLASTLPNKTTTTTQTTITMHPTIFDFVNRSKQRIAIMTGVKGLPRC